MSRLNLSKKNKLFVLVIGSFLLGIIIHIVSSFSYPHLVKIIRHPSPTPLVLNTSLPNSKSLLGTNLNGIADWSTQLPFLDAFKTSRKWITQCKKGDPDCDGKWDTNEYELLDLDKDGWVKSLPDATASPKYTYVETLLLVNSTIYYPREEFVVLYEGEGVIEYGLDAKKEQVSSIPGRDIIKIVDKPTQGISLKITSTDPKKTGNYIRHIRVIKASFEKLYLEGKIFNPKFIEKIKMFKAIRFMSWMGTNNSHQKEWYNRPSAEVASYTLTGVPLEIMISLANQVKVEPWFNIPHLATDEYINNFAQLVKASLDKSLKVYIEYSNEVWNTNFDQGNWIEKEGENEWKEIKESGYTKRINWYGKRSSQICDIWKKVFGNQSSRVVCIMAAQSANSWTTSEALNCPLWSKKPCSAHGFDVLAIAPYFGGYLGSSRYQNQVETWTLDQLFQEINQGGLLVDKPLSSLLQAGQEIQENFAVAKETNLKLVAYEGGQHLVGFEGVENNEKITNLFMSANRDPRMYDIYLKYLNQWKSIGGDLFMHFLDISQYSKWGSWGSLEYLEQPDSPKY